VETAILVHDDTCIICTMEIADCICHSSHWGR